MVGIGVDLLKRGQLMPEALRPEDAFSRAAFSREEHRAAASQPVPIRHYEELFCAKEAIFKALGLDSGHVTFCEITVLQGESGAFMVTLTGDLARRARERGIGRVLVSIAGSGDKVMAFAVAEERIDENGK